MKKLADAIDKLRRAHEDGLRMSKLLRRKPGAKYFMPGEYERVGKEFGVSSEMARKMVAFGERYSSRDLGDLIETCEVNHRAVGFDVVIRLLSINDKLLRDKLQTHAIEQGWSKTQLTQSMKKLRATGSFKERGESLVDVKGRGKPPKAIKSFEFLMGALLDDSSKWHRIVGLMQSPSKPNSARLDWNELSSELQADLENLKKALARFSMYE